MQRIGYWRASLTDDYPLPQHLESETASDVRECVATYLESGALYEQYRGSSWCRFGCAEDNGSAELHDGIWVWPSGLAHYVRVHGIKLPSEFVQHALKSRVVPRSAFDISTEQQVVSDSYWRDWTAQYHCSEFESATKGALDAIPLKVVSALEEVAANLIRERGAGEIKCLSAGCVRLALPDMAFCAYCLAKSQQQEHFRLRFEQEAFKKLLGELPIGSERQFAGTTMNNDEIISRDPDVLGGTPVFAGTRVPVDSLIAHLKQGDSLDDFLEGFPTVSREQAEAFLELALKAAVSEGRDARAA